MFNAKDAPYYIPGIKGVLGLFSAQLVCVGIQTVVIYFLNKQRRRQRVAHGKPEFIKDTSMSAKYEAYDDQGQTLGQNGQSHGANMMSDADVDSSTRHDRLRE